MRKCLNGWVHGSYNFRTKLSAREIDLISDQLVRCNNSKPNDINRAIRKLTYLKFWKGSEYRTFLLYLGPVVLKDFLSTDAYTNFLTLFCAVTFVSCKLYLKQLNLAEVLFSDYIEQYINIYGIDSISSNVHNLCHVVNDVKKFGPLPFLSAYPFENYLGCLKSLLRSGNKPLSQISKRLLEKSRDNKKTGQIREIRILSREKLQLFNDTLLANDGKNCWFLTKTNDIVSMLHVETNKSKIYIFGSSLKNKTDFFTNPIKSSYINIYQSDGKLNISLMYEITEFKCKLFSLKYHNEFVFFPILHTLDINL